MFRSSILSLSTRTAACSSSRLGGRALHASPAAQKTVTEKVSEVADTLNKKVGKGLASAIEKGEEASEVIGTKAKEVKGEAKELGTDAKQKGNVAASKAKEAKEDVQKKI